MAMLPPRLADPSDPDDMARWMREVTELLSGQLSFGDPVAWDPIAEVVDPLRPNGVRGNMLCSFVEVVMESDPDMLVCTHNLNIEPKGWAGANPVWNDPLNVNWITISQQHVGGGGGGGAGQTMYMGGAGSMTANAIELMFHFGDHLVNAGANRAIVRLLFFPTTR